MRKKRSSGDSADGDEDAAVAFAAAAAVDAAGWGLKKK